MGCSDEEIEEMGLTYIVEYSRMQWPREDILAVFMNPHYRGPHTVYRAKGHKCVESLIDRVMGEPDGQGLSENSLSSDSAPNVAKEGE